MTHPKIRSCNMGTSSPHETEVTPITQPNYQYKTQGSNKSWPYNKIKETHSISHNLNMSKHIIRFINLTLTPKSIVIHNTSIQIDVQKCIWWDKPPIITKSSQNGTKSKNSRLRRNVFWYKEAHNSQVNAWTALIT